MSETPVPPAPPSTPPLGGPPAEPRMRVLVVSGMSGAGKSTALNALEDLNYYCVDNLPLPLVSQFLSLLGQTAQKQAALVIDAREGEFLLGFRGAMAGIRRAGHALEVLFLDAPDEVLLRRFSETRRRHPLHGDDLRAGLRYERKELSPLREEAHAVIDTGALTVHQLKDVIQERYGPPESLCAVALVSFGFKYGLPAEADVILDVRFLPNPHFVEGLSKETGLAEPVSSFVLSHVDAQDFLARAESLITFYIPRAEREGKAYLTVGIGCTGGRHRSVALAVELFNRLRGRYQITVRHRELGRGREP